MISGSQLVAIQFSLLPLGLILIIVRLWIRTTRRDAFFSWSDFFVVSAFIIQVAQTSPDIALWKSGFFTEDGNPFTNPNGDTGAAVSALKCLFAAMVLYLPAMYCIKFSLLCFYSEIIPRVLYRTWWCYVFVTVFTICSFIISQSMRMFWCLPVSRNWSTDPTTLCMSTTIPFVGYFTTALHFATDIMIYLLPFPLLGILDLDRRQKIALGLVFGAGFLCVIFAFLTFFVSLYFPDPGVSPIGISLEYLWANIVVCLPSFKTFLRVEIWKRIKQAIKWSDCCSERDVEKDGESTSEGTRSATGGHSRRDQGTRPRSSGGRSKTTKSTVKGTNKSRASRPSSDGRTIRVSADVVELVRMEAESRDDVNDVNERPFHDEHDVNNTHDT